MSRRDAMSGLVDDLSAVRGCEVYVYVSGGEYHVTTDAYGMDEAEYGRAARISLGCSDDCSVDDPEMAARSVVSELSGRGVGL